MTQQYSLEEVKKHIDNKSTWIVIHNNVYDVTPFLNEVSDEKIYFHKIINLHFVIE